MDSAIQLDLQWDVSGTRKPALQERLEKRYLAFIKFLRISFERSATQFR
jgi:hypothetical protein